MRVLRSFFVIAVFACCGSLFASSGGIERFALVAGSNIGGKSTVALKYATEDAKRIQDILVGIGGVKSENAMLLLNPGKENIAKGIEFFANKIARIRDAEKSAQFVFYFSGHSDETGLMLFGEYYRYPELRAALDSLKADVKLVILDSCSSGSITRNKGGEIGLPFLADESSAVEGYAFLTSSTAEEFSQESDKIGSSFFTNALINGLRGAADSDGDGLVSLDEAYAFAYDRTLSATEKTRSGAQHPTFDIKLTGKGTLILTDFKKGESLVTLTKDVKGLVSIRDVTDRLVLEVMKTDDREMSVALDQGYYRILLSDGDALSESVLVIDERREYTLDRQAFKPLNKSANRVRGSRRPGLSGFPLGFSYSEPEANPSIYLNLLGGKAHAVDGIMLSLFYAQLAGNSSGFQWSTFANYSGAEFKGYQATLGVNVASGALQGFQSAGLLNIGNGGKLFQLACVNLSSGETKGAQLGVVNKASRITGVQVGLFNYSEEQTGAQIGLVNVSKRLNGVPLGLIDIQLNGENHVDLIFESAAGNIGELGNDVYCALYFRMGGKYLYKYFNVGVLTLNDEATDEFPSLSAGLGLGGRIPAFFDGFAFNLDAGVNYQTTSYTLRFTDKGDIWHYMVPQCRFFVSSKLYRNMGVICGFEERIYTKYYHENASAGDDLEIVTGAGILCVDTKFFIGVQF